MIERLPERIGVLCTCGDDWNAHHFHDEEGGTCFGSHGCRLCGCGGYYPNIGAGVEKRVRWGDGGHWCNICVERLAVSVGLCEVCKKIPNPGCQLCLSSVPVKVIGTASGHLVSWEGDHAAWIPCSWEERKKAVKLERFLSGEKG